MNCVICETPNSVNQWKHKECELAEQIKDEKKRLKELLLQDESEFSENDKWYRGKKVNMPLVEAHIQYYTKKLDKLKANSLTRWL